MLVKHVNVYYDGKWIFSEKSENMIGFDGQAESLNISKFPKDILSDLDTKKISLEYIINLEDCELLDYYYKGRKYSGFYVPWAIFPKTRGDYHIISENGYGGLRSYNVSYRFVNSGKTTYFKGNSIKLLTDRCDMIDIVDIFQEKKLVMY